MYSLYNSIFNHRPLPDPLQNLDQDLDQDPNPDSDQALNLYLEIETDTDLDLRQFFFLPRII
ncbi:MAG: hypothetical protein DRQ89_11785 [Epsilonproteobacteria bacterium]|nr:MAG: hypothetical protein DRQ89_11785 [Campylobacterota bacterium]